MKDYTESEIQSALTQISEMDHYTMCRIWRFGETVGHAIYLRSDLPTGEAFEERLFRHFGGFTPEISKDLGWDKT